MKTEARKTVTYTLAAPFLGMVGGKSVDVVLAKHLSPAGTFKGKNLWWEDEVIELGKTLAEKKRKTTSIVAGESNFGVLLGRVRSLEQRLSNIERELGVSA